MNRSNILSIKEQLIESALGKSSIYISKYDPDLLFQINRDEQRKCLIRPTPSFEGFDEWTAYEISWLNRKNKPQVYIGFFKIPASSKYLVESKSFKLYLNSFNNTKLSSKDEATNIMTRDLSDKTDSSVAVQLEPVFERKLYEVKSFDGKNIDSADIECIQHESPHVAYLNSEDKDVENEVVYTDLLKSNCPCTGMPDWGSCQISYSGKQINTEGLLKYIISFRNHNEFHEHCIERIYTDIMSACAPKSLKIVGRYTRRGGLDINPIRYSASFKPNDKPIFSADGTKIHSRLPRQ